MVPRGDTAEELVLLFYIRRGLLPVPSPTAMGKGRTEHKNVSVKLQ